MPKTEPFFKGCSSENCAVVTNQVMGSYDRKAHRKKPLPSMIGGMDMRVLEPARIPIMGEQPKEYAVSEHGLGIQFKRCYVFNYIDKFEHKQVSDTCTKMRVVNIPQKTLNCYNDVSELLKRIQKGKGSKGGRTGINYKVLSMIACNKSGLSPTRVVEPMSPAIVATAIGESQFAVRRSMENLIKSGKLATDKHLDVINERQVRLPPKYQKAFDDFIRSEKAERKLAGLKLVFGKDFIASSSDLPEAETFVTGTSGFKPKKLSKKAFEKFQREAEEWKRITGIVPSGTMVKKPSKIKRAPKKQEAQYAMWYTPRYDSGPDIERQVGVQSRYQSRPFLERYDLEQALGVHL